MLLQLLLGGGFPPGANLSGITGVLNITDDYTDGSGAHSGADDTGGADSSAAIAYWLGYAAGSPVWAPPGIYRIKPGVIQFTKNFVTLYCSPGVRFVIDDTLGNSGGDGFLAQDVMGCGIVGAARISAASTRTAGYAVHIKGGDPSVVIATTVLSNSQFRLDVDVDSQFSGLLVDDSTSNGCWGIQIGTESRRALWRDFKAGGTGILINSPKGASHCIDNIFFCNPTATALGGPAVNVKGSGDLRLGKVDALGFVNGFLLDNAGPIANGGGGVCNIKLIGCEFDNTGGAVGADCIRLVPGNVTQPINIEASGLWCSSGYNGIYAAGFSGQLCSFTVGTATIAGQANYGVRGVSPVDTGNIIIGAGVYFGRGAQANSAGNTHFA